MSNEIIVIYAVFLMSLKCFKSLELKMKLFVKLKICQLQNCSVKWKIKVRGEENLITNFFPILEKCKPKLFSITFVWNFELKWLNFKEQNIKV